MRRSPTDGSIMDEDRAAFQVTLASGGSVLWSSRENKAEKCRNLKQRLDEAQGTIARQETEIQRQAEKIRQLEQQTRHLENESQRLAATKSVCRRTRRLKGHKFGRRMIRLAVNLRVVGLRPTERVLTIVWEWLGVQQPLPAWTTIRTWLLRVGVATLREPIEAANDWIWMADHSNQIGPEKALVVLGCARRSCRRAARPSSMRMSTC